MLGDFVDMLAAYGSHLTDMLWPLLAGLLDAFRYIGGGAAGLLGVMFVGLLVGAAWWMQSRLNAAIEEEPDSDFAIAKQEALFSIPGLFGFLLALPFLIVWWVIRALLSFVASLLSADEDEEESEPEPMLAATLGPSFFGAGFVVFALYLVSLAVEPLLRTQLGLSPGYPAWQYLFLGHSPHFAWYVPLDRFPALLSLGSLVFWGILWWWAGRVIRLVYGGDLGRNLVEDRDDGSTLRIWREWFAATDLSAPDDSYMRWAVWAVTGAAPLLVGAWLTTGGAPYRMDPSLASVALFLWLGWGLHLLLDGAERSREADEKEDDEIEPETLGWPDVLEDLEERRQLDPPEPIRPPRPVTPLERSAAEEAEQGAISPLLSELVPGEGGMTAMQRQVLSTLSLQGFVHTTPPVDRRDMAMEDTASSKFRADSEMRHGNQVVLAPEGSGKSTLALLAAANEKLVHTRCSLLVARDRQRAEQLWNRFRENVERSTLRWNIRCRLAGEDLVDDLTQEIVPDVVVTSLEDLTVDILASPASYREFLENLGLIVVDDVESFCGPVELHAQLAFRRLSLRVRELIGVEQLGEESAPRALILGSETMENTPMWARSLFGTDAVARHFGEGGLAGAAGSDEEGPSRAQQVYRLRDFRNASGELLELDQLIASCERLGLPWHYRPAGDGRRELSRQKLNLREEPRHHVDSPAEACVLFVEGHVSDVRREIGRLARAGVDFDPVEAAGYDGDEATQAPDEIPIGVVQIVDRDEATAFTELDDTSPLSDAIESLPRPVVRPPMGEVTESHLAAELTEHWMETEDVLEVFGNETARTLDRLARADLLMTEQRTDVHAERAEYEDELYVRVSTMAVGSEEDGADGGRDILLPPPVHQVELPSVDKLYIRNRTTLAPIEEVDAEGGHFVYYPGRIFENAKGRFVVVGTVEDQGDELEETGPVSGRDVLVEPYLESEISSPRRRTRIRPAAEGSGGDSPESDSDGETIDLGPVFIGDEPVGVGLENVEVEYRHLATYRLSPDGSEVRQRVVRPGSAEPRTMQTTALAVTPNPEVLSERETDAPRLSLRGARVVAAALRAIMPVVYRGADVHAEVMLHVEPEEPSQDRPLESGEGFYLCDPHAGGRGTAMAIRRDGVELLLRFCRLYLERVLSYDRLLARHDHWITPETVRRRSELVATADAELRDEVLRWLDSRLRPERGGLSSTRQVAADEVQRAGREPGEGDPFDAGRCWYSPNESPEDLVWVKHRWQLADFDDGKWPEAMVDVGFDRQTFSELSDPESPAFGRRADRLRDRLTGEGDEPDLPVFPVERTPMPSGGGSAGRTNDKLIEEPPPAVAELGIGLAAHVGAIHGPLEPLASLLQGEFFDGAAVGPDASDEQRYRAATHLARFVQGIPSAGAGESTEAARTALGALIHRSAAGGVREVLLAALLERCGFRTGFFSSPESEHLAVGADLPGVVESETDTELLEVVRERILTWHQAVGSSAEVTVWSVVPEGASDGEPEAHRVYVPIPVREYAAIEYSPFDAVDEWLFTTPGEER